ncbi:hypothetical protein QUB10_21340 [Microcoleus sp. B5-D4]|uniref:hypothetical protein n=1 Tax=unclassified Microcoleus TaxID=2642155 RepID=UPI002FD500C8
MIDKNWKTDEDQQISRLEVHRDLIGWVIQELERANIYSQRTIGNDPKGDILIINPEDAPKVKEIIADIQRKFNG